MNSWKYLDNFIIINRITNHYNVLPGELDEEETLCSFLLSGVNGPSGCDISRLFFDTRLLFSTVIFNCYSVIFNYLLSVVSVPSR